MLLSGKVPLTIPALLSLASGEWVAAMCNASENGILAPQIGQSLGCELRNASFTLGESIAFLLVSANNLDQKYLLQSLAVDWGEDRSDRTPLIAR